TLRSFPDAVQTSVTAKVAPALMQASGAIGVNTVVAAAAPTPAPVQIKTATATTTAELVDSQNASFPATLNSFPVPATTSTRFAQNQLISDGWNRAKSSNASVRTVSDFTPPALDSTQNLERYRNLTRFSPSLTANVTDSLYGGGQGIYIDNSQDKEKIFAGTALREMTQGELVKMWLSQPVPPAAADDYMRTGTVATAPDASLEQKHLRGWVGQDEFRARGVEIVLGDAASPNAITITRDARDDGTANELGGVAAKTWKTSAGANQPGVYSKTFAWPTNGVIFAEGNVRIRGVATNAPRSLTVVSMGNIYIENSISADDSTDGLTNGQPRKILLLAKKNVVMNPTRVLGRPDVQTVVTGVGAYTPGPPTTQTLTVTDVGNFRIGDVVETSSVVLGVPTVSMVGQITNITTGATPSIDLKVLVLSPPATSPVLANSMLRSSPDKTLTASGVTFSKISAVNDTISRHLTIPLSSANLRFAFNHGGGRLPTPVFTVAAQALPTFTLPLSPIYLTNKRVSSTTFSPDATVVVENDKRIRGDYSDPATGSPDTFPTTGGGPTRNKTLSTVVSDMNAAGAQHPGSISGTVGWRYTPTLDIAYSAVPFYYLAGVGNRYNYGAPTLPRPTTVPGWVLSPAPGNNINGQTYEIPLATSVELFLNNGLANQVIYNERYTSGANHDQTEQFGFDPAYRNAGQDEDILTTDQSFYQTDANKSTIDSRRLASSFTVGQNSLSILRSDGLAPLPGDLPAYRLLGIKLENVEVPITGSVTNSIVPAHDFNVHAFVYAQTGSWFVIPSGLFDSRLRGNETQAYFDFDNDGLAAEPGEYLDVTGDGYTAGDFPDFNRNGAVDDAERYAMARYSRYNYQINFTGSIAENQTPIVNSVKTTGGVLVAPGAVESWMNSWATSTKATGSTAVTYDRIKYNFDPTIATDSLDPADNGFRLPQTLDLFTIS
ncbi:MAG TPA: hypothetical protein VGB45_09365, partial [Abditibacterium sp.]